MSNAAIFVIGDTHDARYINVSAEQTNLTPVRLTDLLKERNLL